MMNLYAAPDLRSRIAGYLHGRVIDDQGRDLLDEAADTLCRAEGLLNYWQRQAETAERLRIDDKKWLDYWQRRAQKAEALRDAEMDDGK